MARNALSIQEYTVLGIVWRDGPCTAYHVMMRQATSPAGQHRKRASSTYAVVQKLLKRKLIETDGQEVGRRGDRRLCATPEGRNLLETWVCNVPEVEVAYSDDLIRLRFNFLAVVDPASRMGFIDESLSMLRSVLTSQKEEYEKEKHMEDVRSLSLLGLIYETEARICWLEEAKSILSK